MPTPSLIALDGMDGCGKSTQARLLVEALRREGRDAVLFRDPGGTRIGEAVRGVLLARANHEMDVRTELLLYMASRAQGVAQVVAPALAAGRIVVSDRFLASSLVYQGFAQGIDLGEIRRIGAFATRRIRPAATLVLDLPAREARSRLRRGPDRMEAKGLAFQEKVRRGFRALCRLQPRAFRLVDARGTVDEVHRRIWGVLTTGFR